MKRILLIASMLGLAWPAYAQTPAPAAAVDQRVTVFTEMLGRVQRSSDRATAEEVIKLLDAARDLGRPQAVEGVARSYLSRHADPDPQVVLLAARNAMLAGEYRFAVMRYKLFLKSAPVNADSSDAAGELFRILTDYMGQNYEALAANAEYGDKYRQSAKVKKYDTWFLDSCLQIRDTGAMAKRLGSIFAEKLPLEQERFAYWHQLDRLTDAMANVSPTNAPAILPGRALVPLIRDDARRAARLLFFVENTAFHLTSVGKGAEALDRGFAPVLAAARAYMDSAPAERTLRDIMMAFGGGAEKVDEKVWNMVARQKREFFVSDGFGKLPEADQIAFINWDWLGMPAMLASPEQWIALGGKYPAVFQKAGGTARLPWTTQTSNAPVYKAQAQFLSGHAFAGASMINAMAAAGDANGSIQHLLTQASWYMPFLDRSRNPNVEVFPDMVFSQIIPAWGSLNASAGGAEAQLAFTEGVLFSSVMTPFSPNSVRDALRNAWGYCSQDAARRERYIGLLGKLGWSPFVGDTRDRIFEPVMADFRRWAQDTRRELEGLGGKTNEVAVKRRAELVAVVDQFSKLDAAFKQASEANPDPAKAPNQQCRDVVVALKAIQAGDAAGYAAAAKNLYATIREYEKNKSPFGEALLAFLMTPRDDKLNCAGQQLDFLADQLALGMDPSQRRGASTCVRMLATRPGWRIESGSRLLPRSEDSAFTERVADVLAKAIEARTAKDMWDGELFGWYLGVARRESEQAKAVVSAIVDRDIFTKQNVRWGVSSPVFSALIMIRNEFSSLNAKYTDDIFDDLMVAEIKRTGKVDAEYWRRVPDRMKKVINAAAEAFTADISYTFLGTAAAPAKYSREQFFSISELVMGADGSLVAAYMAKLASAYGKTRFDSVAAGEYSLRGMVVDTAQQRTEFFARLREYLARAKTMPYNIALSSLPQVHKFQADGASPLSLSDEEISTLAESLRYARLEWQSGERLVALVNEGLSVRRRFPEMIAAFPEMWRICHRLESMRMLEGFASKMMFDGEFAAVAALATAGLEIAATRLPEDVRNSLSSLRSRAMTKVGGSVMVARSDKRYSILSAQALFHAGLLESAWEQYVLAPELARTEFRSLDLAFSIWLVERHTGRGDFDQANTLAQILVQWVDAAVQSFDPETRTQVYLAAGDISMAAQDYPRAKAQYNRVVVAKEFAGTLGAARAELKIAAVDRMTRNFDASSERLDKMAAHRDTSIQTEVRYQRAMLKFDQEDYAGAREAVHLVYAIAPNHAYAALLEGQLNIKTKKLLEGTQVKIGLASDQQFMIPGRAVRVWLEDATLSVVGRSTDIELRIWSDSGDEEVFTLQPFGDSKTRFRGEIGTELASTKKGDRVLQVLGRDKVHYGFSEKFRKVARVAVDDNLTLEVLSDGELYASSGKIATREERDRASVEESLRKKAGQNEDKAKPTGPLGEIRTGEQVKPGNPVYVMVVDPDRSTTHKKDTLFVQAGATSGDSVGQFPLEETETHSGIFIGKLPTQAATATAFASDTEEGREANYIISSDTSLPPWVALASRNRHKMVTVDMNSNVALGTLQLLADVPGRTLRRFVLQTSLNGRDFTSVAAWPNQLPSWDGALRLRLVRYDGDPNAFNFVSTKSTPDDKYGYKNAMRAYLDYFDYGSMVEEHPVHIQAGRTATDLRQTIRIAEPRIGVLRHEGPGSWALAHLQGTFYMPERRTRKFKVDPKGVLENVKYLLAIDGLPAVSTLRTDQRVSPVEVIVSLGKGYHTIEMFAAVQSQSKAAYELLWDVKEEPYIARIPDTAMTAAGWPADTPPPGSKKAALKANEANTQFEMTFAPGASARLLRCGIFDFDSDAPALRTISLTSVDGKKVLPLDGDVMALRRNQILEIVPGDRITVAYQDPFVVDRARQSHEAFLDVTFHNASIVNCLVESMVDRKTNTRKPVYIPIRSYRPDVPMAVFVSDPDMDQTEKPEQVDVSVRSLSGPDIPMKLLEMGDNSGMFVGRFFPVTGTPKRDADLPVTLGDDFSIAYRDEHNTDPGIPWDRQQEVRYVPEGGKSELRVFNCSTSGGPLSSNEIEAIVAGHAKKTTADSGQPPVQVVLPVTRGISVVRPESTQPAKNLTLVPGVPLIFEVLNPSLAFPPLSTVEVMVQIITGDQAVARSDVAFDPSLPGTIRYRWGQSGTPGGAGSPPGYAPAEVIGDQFAIPGQDHEGRFTFVIPTQLGSFDQMNTNTEVTEDMTASGKFNYTVNGFDEEGKRASIGLVLPTPTICLRPDYMIRVAMNTADKKPVVTTNAIEVAITNAIATNAIAVGAAAANVVDAGIPSTNMGVSYVVTTNLPPDEWQVWEVRLMSDPTMYVADQKYQRLVNKAYIGDRLYLRVIDAMADVTMEKDEINVLVITNNAMEVARSLTLKETFENTGIFEGNIRIVNDGVTNAAQAPDTLRAPYGADILFQYRSRGRDPLDWMVKVYKGADGTVFPFTKRFLDAEIAVQTQFTMAECYFEMAKKYRELKEEETARRTIAQAKKVLDEAIRDYPKSTARIQADYLLANLAYESGEQTKDPELRRRLFIEAVGKFSDLVASHPDSDYAPKAQFKKALVFERMGQLDTACEEYVKLSYRYPDNPLVAETIARLGGYFMNRGRGIESGMEGEVDPLKKEKIRYQAQGFYRVAAQVFIRLSARFPDHSLAAKTTVLSAENWLRAGDPDKAVPIYEALITEKKAPSDLMAQAMYWCAESYVRWGKKDPRLTVANTKRAYVMYKRVTWDYPQSQWAKFARGRLTTMKEP